MGLDLYITRVKRDQVPQLPKSFHFGDVDFGMTYDDFVDKYAKWSRPSQYEFCEWCDKFRHIKSPNQDYTAVYVVDEEFINEFNRDWSDDERMKWLREIFRDKLTRTDKYYYLMVFDW